MSWAVLLGLAGGAYAFKALGLVVLGERRLPESFTALAALFPAALLSALVVVQTLADGRSLTIDARLAGLVVAVVAVWRKAPFVVVVPLAAAVTALARAAGG